MQRLRRGRRAYFFGDVVLNHYATSFKNYNEENSETVDEKNSTVELSEVNLDWSYTIASHRNLLAAL